VSARRGAPFFGFGWVLSGIEGPLWGLARMWESRGKPAFGFPAFSTARHFHNARRVSSAFPFLVQGEEELSFCLLPTSRRFGIALFPSHPVQQLDTEFRFEASLCLRRAHQFAQRFPGCGVAPVHELFLAVRIRDSLRLSARTMEVQAGVELTLIKPVDVPGMLRRNVAVAHMLADCGSVFRLHEPVVAAPARPRFGLPDQQLSEQAGDGVVDKLRAVVGMKTADGKGKVWGKSPVKPAPDAPG